MANNNKSVEKDAREKKASSELPMDFVDQTHKALVSVWWTGNLMKRSFLRIFKGVFRSEAQFNLLRVLKFFEGPHTQNDLATKLLVNKSNITLLIDGLEKQGYIERLRVPNDRRSYHIAFTEDGRKRFDILDSKYEEFIGTLSRKFSEEDQEDLNRITCKIRNGLKVYFGSGNDTQEKPCD